ncbi:hypothetical protein Cme02nite_28430 [Catellatospora methionotrophica]|uniref:VWFD domain-containing protein n=1 Tax=Catellatospora methionotrophica TaxID=121620 RepID=A0A8J3LG35_9ACTN|nr:VWD domain-containing protein [Catellatospora methionotrophica]GIG14511.1 hypothetical protein Cme02nite_28430 [Catellatospora methionotrophica]
MLKPWRTPAGTRWIALATVLVLAAGAGWWWFGRADETAPNAWDRLYGQLSADGTVSLDLARQAFTLAYTPLPGVEKPPGEFGPARSTSDAAAWILSHWNELTGAEQAIVADALGLSGTGPVVNGMRLAAASAPQVRWDCPQRAGLRISEAKTDEYAAVVPGVKAELARLLGADFTAAVIVCRADNDKDEFGQDILADTLGQYLPDGSYRCRVTVFKGGQAYQGTARLAIFVHELTHCLFRQIAVDRRDANGFVAIPPWIDEGLNQWVTYRVVGATPDLTATLAGYAAEPGRPVFQRSYTALGFFGYAEQVWPGLQERVKDIVGVAGEDYSMAAYIATIGAGSENFLAGFASSFTGDAGRGPAWWVNMPGLGSHGAPADAQAVTNEGGPAAAASQPYAAGLVRLAFSADVVMLSQPQGSGPIWGRFGADPGIDLPLHQAAQFVYCARPGGCQCPDGYRPDLNFIPIGQQAWLTVTGADQPAVAAATGLSLDRFCREKPKPKPMRAGRWDAGAADPNAPGGPGAKDGLGDDKAEVRCTGCGGSTTDPHLNTYDGHYYDLQSVGEYTLTASPDGQLEVQSRTAPVAGSTTAAINVAFAMRVGADRVGFTGDAGAITVRVNGTVTEVGAGGLRLPGGGQLRRGPQTYLLTWPDGSQAWVFAVQASLTVQVGPAPEHRGRMRGLLGDFDGDKRGDLKLRDGTTLTDPSFADIHGRLVDSWRVTEQTTLFDYGPGQSTATFTDPDFPSGPVTAQNSPDRAAAEQACRAAGVTDPVQLANCVVDVGVTGDTGYATGAAALQRFLADTVRSGQTLGDGRFAGGDIGSAQQRDRFPLALGAARWFYVSGWTGPGPGCDQSLSISLVGVSNDHRPCTGGTIRFEVPDPKADYRLEVVGVDGKKGRYQFELVTIKVRELAARIGERVTGRIDVPGRMDLYALDRAAAGKARFTDTPDCAAGIWYEVLNLDTGKVEVGARPFCGPVEFVPADPAARYGLGITQVDLSTADYTFTVPPG